MAARQRLEEERSTPARLPNSENMLAEVSVVKDTAMPDGQILQALRMSGECDLPAKRRKIEVCNNVHIGGHGAFVLSLQVSLKWKLLL